MAYSERKDPSQNVKEKRKNLRNSSQSNASEKTIGRDGKFMFGTQHMQQKLLQNPDVMMKMMNSKLLKGVMKNPQMIEKMMANNPQMSAIINQNPKLLNILKDPQILKESLQSHAKRQKEIEQKIANRKLHYASQKCVGAHVSILTDESTIASARSTILRRKATISVMNDDGSCDVLYDDGDKSCDEENDIQPNRVILIPPTPSNLSAIPPFERLQNGKNYKVNGKELFQIGKFAEAELQYELAIKYLDYAISIPNNTIDVEEKPLKLFHPVRVPKKTIIRSKPTSTTSTKAHLPLLYPGIIACINSEKNTYDIIFEDDSERNDVPMTEIYSDLDPIQQQMLPLLGDCINNVIRARIQLHDIKGALKESYKCLKLFTPLIVRLRLRIIVCFILRARAFIINKEYKKAKSELKYALKNVSKARKEKKPRSCLDYKEEKILKYEKEIERLKKQANDGSRQVAKEDRKLYREMFRYINETVPGM